MIFSVVIPTYRRPESIGSSIESVIAQKDVEVEIVIVDDNGAGTDMQKRTFNEIQRYSEKCSITYLVHEVNRGACAARNTGIIAASGDAIAFLDDDDKWENIFLAEMKKKIEAGAWIVYSDFFRIDKKGIFYNPKEENHEGNVYDYLLSGWCPASTSLFCIRKECFNKVGTFDERLKNIEEYDLWIRMSEKYPFDFCSKKLVFKDETEHEQLTKNYNSRRDACKQLLDIWEKRIRNSEKLRTFEENINNQIAIVESYMYIEELLEEKSIVAFGRKLNATKLRGQKKLVAILSYVIGVSRIEGIKDLYRMFRGCKRYVNLK